MNQLGTSKNKSGKGCHPLNHPHRAGGPCSPLKHTWSVEKAQASTKGPSHVLELPGKGNNGPGIIIWDSVHCVCASSSSQDTGTYFTSLSSRQLQLHHTGWLRLRGELGNVTNYSISKCYFSVTNWRMSVPNLNQTWIFLKSFEMLQLEVQRQPLHNAPTVAFTFWWLWTQFFHI